MIGAKSRIQAYDASRVNVSGIGDDFNDNFAPVNFGARNPPYGQIYHGLLKKSIPGITGKELLAADVRKAPKQQMGFKSAMIADVRPLTDGRSNKVTFNLTPEIIHQIFAEKPTVHKAYLNFVPRKMSEMDFWTKYCRPEYLLRTRNVVAAAEVAEDEELAVFLKHDEILANEAHRKLRRVDPILDMEADQAVVLEGRALDVALGDTRTVAEALSRSKQAELAENLDKNVARASYEKVALHRVISIFIDDHSGLYIGNYARPLDDGLYRAIDIYLKFVAYPLQSIAITICINTDVVNLQAHPWLTESEKEQVCRLMDCQKLSLEACTHAAQNERLPLRVVVQVLFFEQLQLRTSIAGCFLVSENLDGSRQLRSGFAGSNEGGGWATAVRENQVLKVGMDSMRMRLKWLELGQLDKRFVLRCRMSFRSIIRCWRYLKHNQ
ncbi:hypothetical protein IFM89_027923 [Coptis chinensis]|uniref:BSD domain-containing protein n=1 Tax=Coptis chinensis TaxID=261450 RepID=A0A835HHJ6_9MAGN|nr:hypothetical protein IFM89_027923 [Coptis chinensis]